MTALAMKYLSVQYFSRFGVFRAFSSVLGKVAGGFLLILVAIAFLAPWITPYDVAAQNLANANASPSWAHIMGTDEFGRDVFSRVVYGARTSLSVSATAIGISMSVGANGCRCCWWRLWR